MGITHKIHEHKYNHYRSPIRNLGKVHDYQWSVEKSKSGKKKAAIGFAIIKTVSGGGSLAAKSGMAALIAAHPPTAVIPVAAIAIGVGFLAAGYRDYNNAKKNIAKKSVADSLGGNTQGDLVYSQFASTNDLAEHKAKYTIKYAKTALYQDKQEIKTKIKAHKDKLKDIKYNTRSKIDELFNLSQNSDLADTIDRQEVERLLKIFEEDMNQQNYNSLCEAVNKNGNRILDASISFQMHEEIENLKTQKDSIAEKLSYIPNQKSVVGIRSVFSSSKKAEAFTLVAEKEILVNDLTKFGNLLDVKLKSNLVSGKVKTLGLKDYNQKSIGELPKKGEDALLKIDFKNLPKRNEIEGVKKEIENLTAGLKEKRHELSKLKDKNSSSIFDGKAKAKHKSQNHKNYKNQIEEITNTIKLLEKYESLLKSYETNLKSTEKLKVKRSDLEGLLDSDNLASYLQELDVKLPTSTGHPNANQRRNGLEPAQPPPVTFSGRQQSNRTSNAQSRVSAQPPGTPLQREARTSHSIDSFFNAIKGDEGNVVTGDKNDFKINNKTRVQNEGTKTTFSGDGVGRVAQQFINSNPDQELVIKGSSKEQIEAYITKLKDEGMQITEDIKVKVGSEAVQDIKTFLGPEKASTIVQPRDPGSSNRATAT